MGFFRRLFTSKKPSTPPPPPPTPKPAKSTKRWSFPNKSHTAPPQPKVSVSNSLSSPYAENSDANRHAIAVAAATAVVAEAALAAAQAAAEVVRLTSGTDGGYHHRSAAAAKAAAASAAAAAAVKIQSAFRGYLARRALRALKALVKLQALVRGHIVRKQTSDMLRRMQTLVRLQARARENRTHMSESSHFSSNSTFSPQSVKQVPTSFKTNKDKLRANSTGVDGSSTHLKRCGSRSNFRSSNELDRPRCDSNWLDRWMEENLWNKHGETPLRTQQADDEKSDKILEVDTWKPHLNAQQRNRNFETSHHILAASDYNSQSYTAKKASNPNPSLSSEDVLSVSSCKPGIGARRSPFTPTRSEYSWKFFGGYADHDHPNYMTNTEASRAKVRAQSAPRQRPEYGRYGSSKMSVQGFGMQKLYQRRDLLNILTSGTKFS